MEKVIETKICKCGSHFDVTDKDLEFYDKVSPIFGGIKYGIPAPTLCPLCRQQRRLSFRNDKHLYKRTCDATGKEIISIYSPDKPYKVFNQHDWWSDKWDIFKFGRDFDFSRGFFEQFNELLLETPRMSLISMNSENSSYTNLASDNKDCYLIFSAVGNTNSLYGLWVDECKDAVDSYGVSHIEDSYYCIDCKYSKNCFFCFDIENCFDMKCCYDCIGCKNCIGCSGLRNKEYYILNKPYSKEGYIEEAKKMKINNELFISTFKNAIHNNLSILNSENVIGDYISNSKNITYGYRVEDSENSKFVNFASKVESCFDMDFNGGTVNSYEGSTFDWSTNTIFSFIGHESSYLIYSDNCYSSSYLFGCTGLRNAKYCIFNKQYTKEEYETLVPKIIEHMKKTEEWGEFFPSSISPFGYNETVANEYHLLSQDEALSKGFKWSDYESPFPKVEKIIPASKLPENINDIPDDILNWAIECEVTNKPFRIIKQELDFYRKHNLPIPRRHPDQRHLDRMKLRNPSKIYDRHCDKCSAPIKTTYSPQGSEIVYCETCYGKEVA